MRKADTKKLYRGKVTCLVLQTKEVLFRAEEGDIDAAWEEAWKSHEGWVIDEDTDPRDRHICDVQEVKLLDAHSTPAVGDVIYVSSAYYMDHGQDDVCGGLAQITKTQMRGDDIFISIEQHPGRMLNWAFLGPEQGRLAEMYGGQWAHPCPDRRYS